MIDTKKYAADALFYFPLTQRGLKDFVTPLSTALGDALLFTDEQPFTNLSAESVAFTSLSELPANGDTLVGATSTETAIFMFAVITGGTVGGGDASGKLFVKTVSGAFQAENLDISGGNSNVMTIGGDFTAGLFQGVSNGMSCVALTAAEMTCRLGEIHIIDSATKVWEDRAIRFDTFGNALAQRNAEDTAQTIVPGTVDTATNSHTPTTTQFQADDITEATANHFKGRVVIFTTGALQDQAAPITAYEQVGGIGQFTVEVMTDAPANDDKFRII